MHKKIGLAFFIGFLFLSLSVFSSRAQTTGPILSQTLRLGSTGSEVLLLQQFLKDLGYFSYPTTTGFFGRRTKDAVIAFQKANNLPTTGVVGPLTRKKIAEYGKETTSVTLPNGSKPPVPFSSNLLPVGYLPQGLLLALPSGGVSDTTLPTVSVTEPAGGASVQGTIALSASASDNVAVASVQFQIDGVNAGSADTTAPYGTTLNTNTVTEGPHTITAVARDSAGNTTTSEGVAITVDRTAPLVTIPGAPTNPAALGYSGIPLDFDFLVMETNTLASIEMTIYNAAPPNNVITTETLNVPAAGSHTFTWSSPTPSDGSYLFEVRATDAAGNVGVATHSFNVTVDITSYSITVVRAGTGSGLVTSTPAGIACGATCSSDYAAGTMVTLNASSQLGSTFAGWSGACSGQGSCIVTADAPTSVTATFDVITYTVGGTVSGLTGTVTLQNNGGDTNVIISNGPFTFSTPMSQGSTYDVTVLSQPENQICTVTNGAGTMGGSSITNVAVTCDTLPPGNPAA